MSFVAVKCPGCGANVEIDESREFGFCTYCGTKVVQDKVVVEHRGNVKVDNSEYVQKFLLNARRALNKEDWEEVEKYYNLVEQNAPHNMEAVFFSSFAKTMLSFFNVEYFEKRKQKVDVLNRSISVISDYYEQTNEDKKEVLSAIGNYILKMYSFNFVFGSSYDGKAIGSDLFIGTKKWVFKCLDSIKSAFVTELNQIYSKHKEEYIQDLIKTLEKEETKSGGCYVATAVYGSYDCPQVWTLRRYRDTALSAAWYGRAFIKIYYAISPTIVKWFGNTAWLNRYWRKKLDRMVEKLKQEGYKDTPYID